MPTKASLSLLSCTETIKEGLWVMIRTVRDSYSHRQNRLDLGKLVLTLATSTCFRVGSSMINRWISTHCGPHGLQRHSLTHRGLHHGLQGSLCFGTWGTFSLSFTHLGTCRVVPLKYSHSSLLTSVGGVQVLPSLLNYVLTEVIPLSLLGSALAGSGSLLEQTGIPSSRSFPQQQCLQTPHYQNLTTQTKYEGMRLQSPQMILAMHLFFEIIKSICLNHHITMEFAVKHTLA